MMNIAIRDKFTWVEKGELFRLQVEFLSQIFGLLFFALAGSCLIELCPNKGFYNTTKGNAALSSNYMLNQSLVPIRR